MPRHHTAPAAALAATLLIGLASLPAVPPGLVDRAGVPDKAEASRGEEKVRARHKEEYARAGQDPAARLALAGRLLEEGQHMRVDPAERFVLLREARDLAAAAADPAVALQAADELARRFALDADDARAEALARAAAGVRTLEGGKAVIEAAQRLGDEAVDADRYEQALRLAASAEQAARRAKDLPLVLSVQRYERGLRAARQQFARLRPFVERLRKDPEDSDANGEVGRYLVLLKGEWGRGLFLLAQGNDPALRLLAQRDLAHPDTTGEQVEMGDAWWRQAEREKDQAQVHLRQRAVFWYLQVGTGPDEATRARLDERIAAVPLPRPRPVAPDYSGPARELVVLRGHANQVFGAAFSPDGKHVLSGDVSGMAIVWDAGAGKQALALRGHAGMIWSVAYGPKGRFAFTGSWDGTVKMWEARSGREVRHFPAQGRIQNINGLAVSPDGKRLLAGCDDGAVHVWDVDGGQELRQLRGHNGFVYGVAVSPDGKQALSGGANDGTMILWDVQTGNAVRRFQGLRGNIRTVAISPDGRTALSSGDNDVVLWDLKTGREVRRFKGHTQPVNAVAFAPDGRRILSGGGDGSVRLWDAATGRELHRYTGHNAAVFGVAFSPGGGRAVSAGQDTTVRVWGLPLH
jgi:outer membrane protein assembly factor BamB